eukprot:14918_1
MKKRRYNDFITYGNEDNDLSGSFEPPKSKKSKLIQTSPDPKSSQSPLERRLPKKRKYTHTHTDDDDSDNDSTDDDESDNDSTDSSLEILNTSSNINRDINMSISDPLSQVSQTSQINTSSSDSASSESSDSDLDLDNTNEAIDSKNRDPNVQIETEFITIKSTSIGAHSWYKVMHFCSDWHYFRTHGTASVVDLDEDGIQEYVDLPFGINFDERSKYYFDYEHKYKIIEKRNLFLKSIQSWVDMDKLTFVAANSNFLKIVFPSNRDPLVN